jgi:hypothetical protein
MSSKKKGFRGEHSAVVAENLTKICLSIPLILCKAKSVLATPCTSIRMLPDASYADAINW